MTANGIEPGLRVLVTAGASGIGRCIADAFAGAGARVAVSDISDEALATCGEATPSLTGFLSDVSKAEEVDTLFTAVEAAFGGLDILVNNAGIAGPVAAAEDIAIEDWQRTLDVNLNGVFYCLRRAIPLLKATTDGGIINIASTAGLMGCPSRAPYVASKWALVGLTKSLAMELGPFGIRVNAICPGSVEGERIERVIDVAADAHGLSRAQVRATWERQSSLRRFTRPEDIAAMALYLASPAGALISGQALAIDGHTETLG